MAISKRNSNLFAAENWEVAYSAYTNVSFKAYDFSTMRSAMLNYIRENYPESFNDYIESSEFVAIIELLSYLSQSLAFRVDLNTRENFLSTAESKDSILRLANMLGYTPKRNIPASGLIKVTAISTTEPILDTSGVNLQNTTIEWDDEEDPDSFDKFVAILNSAMTNNNPFTKPIISKNVGTIPTEIYALNSQTGKTIGYEFQASVNGETYPFEIVSSDINENNVFREAQPDVYQPIRFVYRNDKKGLDSANTGFFFMFKQGELIFEDYIFDRALANRFIDVNDTNINETDVYFQQLDENAVRKTSWKQVPNLTGQTLAYNSLSLNVRNVYSVENTINDGIRIKFSDGNLGNVPTGIFRLYYRKSAGTSLTLRPENFNNLTIDIPYFNSANELHNLTISLELQNSVFNSAPAESLGSIKNNAPQTYYTQDRMVSAQDYNVYPLSQSVNILKLKATNRTHAGHSRYIDIEDPTGRFSKVTSYADDGALYKDDEPFQTFITFGLNKTETQILKDDISNITKHYSLQNYIYDDFRKVHNASNPGAFDLLQKDILWKTQPSAPKNETGYFTTLNGGTREILNNSANDNRIIQEGSYLRFRNPNDPTDQLLASITEIQNSAVPLNELAISTGVVKLSRDIPNGWLAYEILPSLNADLLEQDIAVEFQNKIKANEDFGIGYDYNPINVADSHWYIIDNTQLQKDKNFVAQRESGASWLIKAEYNMAESQGTISKYTFTSRGSRYIFESLNDIKFYFSNDEKTYDSTTGKIKKDIIELTTENFKPQIKETYIWEDTDEDGISDSWKLVDSDATYMPSGASQNIVLRGRNSKAKDLELRFISNFGILQNGETTISGSSNYAQGDFISPVEIPIKVDPVSASTGKAVVRTNSGTLTTFPSEIQIPVSQIGESVTGGANGNIAYVKWDIGSSSYKTYQGNATTTSYEVGAYSNEGHIDLLSKSSIKISDFDTLTNRWQGFRHKDRLDVIYRNSKETLDEPLQFEVVDPYKYNDGYSDPSKMIVAPLDSNYDGFPDNPSLFDDFVASTDFVFFETKVDLDGYSYEKPAKFKILDLQAEDEISVNFGLETIAPGSNPDDTTKFSDFDLIYVKSLEIAQQFLGNSVGKLIHKLVFPVAKLPKVYELINDLTTPKLVILSENNAYNVKPGRSFTQNILEPRPRNCSFKWNHFAPSDVRIDPSISNIIEMFVITKSFYNSMIEYKNKVVSKLPEHPTSDELAQELSSLDNYKSLSDQMVFTSGKFKLLFGSDAGEEVQAQIKVVKLPNTTTSDTEIRSAVLELIDQYFSISNWDFGETFYFSELSAFIHQELGGQVATVVIVPSKAQSNFGDLYQVRCEPDEFFMSTATVDNVEVVKSLTSINLKQSTAPTEGTTSTTATSSSSSSSSSSGSSSSGSSGSSY